MPPPNLCNCLHRYRVCCPACFASWSSLPGKHLRKFPRTFVEIFNIGYKTPGDLCTPATSAADPCNPLIWRMACFYTPTYRAKASNQLNSSSSRSGRGIVQKEDKINFFSFGENNPLKPASGTTFEDFCAFRNRPRLFARKPRRSLHIRKSCEAVTNCSSMNPNGSSNVSPGS